MEIRIKERNKRNSLVYDVQVKRFLRWKTMETTPFLDKALEIFENLKKMDKANHSNPKVSYLGWMVRNQYTSGISNYLDIYAEYPNYQRGDAKYGMDGDVVWRGTKICELRTTNNLFGMLGLEPEKVKITIEKIV